MAESKIEWTEKTWNPTTGCSSVGKECNLCYARTLTNRYKHNSKLPKYRQGFDVVVEHPDTLKDPHKWKIPSTIFVNSMSDLFHKDISLGYIKKVFSVMNDSKHTYQILTKRDLLLKRYSKELTWTDNIWMGVSVGIQASTKRIESLRQCGAKHKFLSVEPLIEEITKMDLSGINLVFVGGESGDNNARPMEKSWVMTVKTLCDQAGAAFFFKQWGLERNNPDPNDPTMNKAHRYYAKGGCMIDGKLYLTNPSTSDDSTPTLKLFGEDYYIMSDKYELNTIWELKSYLPEMEKQLFDQLKADIKKNGVNDPILYWVTSEGVKLVIEGHTRLQAAIQSKLKSIPMKEVKDAFNSLDDIKLWIIRHQFQRRNLSAVEKIQLAYLSKDTIEKTAKENLSKAGKGYDVVEHIDTNAEIARIAGVGRTTVVRYSAVMERASKSVLTQLYRGEISISSAHNSVKHLPEQSAEPIIDKPKREEPEVKLLTSIERGKKLLRAGDIESLIVLKDKTQLYMLTAKQKSKAGVYLLKDSD
jgi:protein gp37/ParB-like chromosome segregation protein Spo0J